MTYITTQELACKLGCCEETIRNMIHAGKLPCIQLGRHYRFDWEKVEKHLKTTSKRKRRSTLKIKKKS